MSPKHATVRRSPENSVQMTIDNTNTLSRWTVLFWLFLSVAISAGCGYWVESNANGDGLTDFRAIYFSARAVMDRRDPYRPGDFLEAYKAEGGTFPKDTSRLRAFNQSVPVCVNLPSTLFVIAPIALLKWAPAHFLWMLLLPAGLILAGWLAWEPARIRAPRIACALICLLLANCEILLLVGNASAIVVCLCVVATWCLLRGHFPAMGILCLGVALAIKPQEVGFVWLYFLLAGGRHRRRAVQALGITLALFLLGALWVSRAAPQWYSEWRSNVASTTARGGINDSGPAALGNAGLVPVVNLQSVIGWICDDPRIYNPATYLIVGSLIVVWAATTLLSKATPQRAWLALASISALTLLPVYHREYDCKLLVLMIPGLAVLWAENRSMRKVALAVTLAGAVLTADIPLTILFTINKSLNLPPNHLAGKILSVLLARVMTFALLLVGTFYLWAYAWYARSGHKETRKVQGPDPELGTTSA